MRSEGLETDRLRPNDDGGDEGCDTNKFSYVFQNHAGHVALLGLLMNQVCSINVLICKNKIRTNRPQTRLWLIWVKHNQPFWAGAKRRMIMKKTGQDRSGQIDNPAFAQGDAPIHAHGEIKIMRGNHSS